MHDKAIKIPPESLTSDALEGVIKDFILREGTDYGEIEYSLEEKISQVELLLKQGKAHIWYDEETQSINLLETKN